MKRILTAEQRRGNHVRARAADLKSKMFLQTDPGSPVGRITMAGLLRNHPGMPENPTRTLGSYAVVYLLRGEGTYRDERGVRQRLVPGDFLTVFPDIPHWYGPGAGKGWDEIYLVFSGEVFDLWRDRGLLDPRRPIRHLEPLDYWLRRLLEVTEDEADSLAQVCALQHLLAEAIAVPSSAREPEWLTRAKALLGRVENNPPAQTASLLGMSYESFRKRFVAATGDSPNHYRLIRLMERACSMIVTGGATNKQIAERLGFCDEFNFSHRFKEVVGMSPADFRHKLPQTAGKSVRGVRRTKSAG